MNRERAKERLPIITAFAEGKTIQMRYSIAPNKHTGWIDVEDIFESNFATCDAQYRIKPEPKEYWVRREALYHTNRKKAYFPDGELIKVREVLDDE